MKTSDKQRECLKRWRKRNPHYSRDYMRAKRGSRVGIAGRWPGRKSILGVSVQVNIVERMFGRYREAEAA